MKTKAIENDEPQKSLFLWQRFKTEGRDFFKTWKNEGFKKVIKKYGWKFFLIVFFYYLIRDITLYIILPLLVAKLSWGH